MKLTLVHAKALLKAMSTNTKETKHFATSVYLYTNDGKTIAVATDTTTLVRLELRYLSIDKPVKIERDNLKAAVAAAKANRKMDVEVEAEETETAYPNYESITDSDTEYVESFDINVLKKALDALQELGCKYVELRKDSRPMYFLSAIDNPSEKVAFVRYWRG